MEELVRFIVEHLVSNKDAVKIETSKDNENTSTIFVEVDKEDMGKVIGKNGKIASSIRAIVKTASADSNMRYYVQIVEK